MSDLIKELDDGELRNFALSFGAMVALLFGLLFPWVFARAYPSWPWLLCVGCAVWGLLAPGTLRPFYRLWVRFGLLLSRITSPVMLGIIYFLVITPTGLIAGLFREDPMRRDFREGCGSFRQKSEAKPPKHMERPF